MFLSTVEVEKNIKWLQENASPAVLYLTHINLLGADPRSEFMKALWEKVKSDPEVVKVFSLQNEDGSWFSGGPWGPRGYRRKTGDGFTATRPKFVTTAWILPFLGEIGFKPDYEPIKKSTDFILSELKSKKDCGLRTQVSNCCGLSAISLWGLASVGITDEECLRNQWEKLICCQRADGGMVEPESSC